MKRVWIAILLLLSLSQIQAQYYLGGQEPSGTKWKQIKNDTLNILFPVEAAAHAKRYAIYQSFAWSTIPNSNSKQISQTPIVLHPNSITSNGFVSWAPKRIEVVTTPAFDSEPEPWFLTLAVHETRHVSQMNALNKGFFRLGSLLLGQQSVGMAAGMVPLWFLEGDAVFAETMHTKGGRGRQASFYRHYLATLAEKGNLYSHSKWLLGSYKNYIPNHYNFGYMMVGYTNLKYNDNIWAKALNDVSKKPYHIFPFRVSVKKSVKRSLPKLFNESLSYSDSVWNEYAADTSNIWVYKLNKSNRDYSEYQYPYLTSDSLLISLKTSLGKGPTFVCNYLESGKEESLSKPGYLTHKPFINDTLILWSQYQSDLRWEYRNFSDIWMYNFRLKKRKRITKRTKYFNPIVVEKNRIAAIEYSPEGIGSITVIDYAGNDIKRIKLPEDLELKEIASDQAGTIVSRSASQNGAIILKHSLKNSSCDTLFGPYFRDISNIALHDSKLLFTMTDEYREQLFEYNTKTNTTTKLTNSPFGVSKISLSSKKHILASYYSSNGSNPCIVSLPRSKKPFNIQNYQAALFQEEIRSNFKTSKSLFASNSIELKESRIPFLKKFINIHSWAPLYYNPSELAMGNIEIYPGATLISQNLTSTLVASAGYSHNKTHGLHGYVEWLGWFPKISLKFDYGNTFSEIVGGPLAYSIYSSTPNINAEATIRIPLSLSSGYLITTVNTAIKYGYTNSSIWDFGTSQYNEGINTIEPYFSLISFTRMAHRDIRPKLGLSIFGGANRVLNLKSSLGDIFYSRSTFYFPGFFTNHSLMINGLFEYHTNSDYLRPSKFYPIRGHTDLLNKQLLILKLDYAFPVLYPDLAAGSLVYLKRIILNAFCDSHWSESYLYEQNQWALKSIKRSSVGFELSGDMHFLRIQHPIRLGYRGGYNRNSQSFFHQFILGFDISSLYGNSYNSK